ncbi:MAG: RagB/SusD family nutrient uptake outer membrane protein [Bacteroidota bacterium]|nr:RagB/SusD family nutrient uptake outer membrane protein [Bacteroidota bacterium]
MKKLFQIFTLFFLILLSFSCSKDFLDRQPLDKLTTSNFYKTEDEVQAALLAAYANLKTQRWYGHYYFYLNEVASDDCTEKNKYGTDLLDNFQWVSGPNNFTRALPGSGGMDLFATLWRSYYESILRSNLAYDNVDKPAEMSDIKRKYVKGQARFLRGNAYWHLATTFGDAIIYTKSSEQNNLNDLYRVRSPRSEVFAQAEKDFIEAAANLPDSWSGNDLGRATKWAAIAMLGKTYLYQQKWLQAADQFRLIIASGQFQLLDDFTSVFALYNEHNKETVFEIEYTDRGDPPNYNSFYQDGGNANQNTERDLRMGIQGQDGQRAYQEIIALKDLAFEFEFNDPRLTRTLYFVRADKKPPYDTTLEGYGDGNSRKSGLTYKPSYGEQVAAAAHPIQEFFHIKKAVNGFTGGQSPHQSGNNWRMIRYADILLMAAEAIAEANGGPTAEAVGYLNQVRARARKMLPANKLNDVATVSGGTYTLSPDVMPTPELLAAYPSNQKILMDYPSSDASSLVIWSPQSYAIFADVLEPIIFDFSLDGFRKAIVHERRVELATEYHRFPDIKRWDEIEGHPGGASNVFPNKLFNPLDKKSYVKGKHNLCPISQYQIDLSGGTLKQNPGY